MSNGKWWRCWELMTKFPRGDAGRKQKTPQPRSTWNHRRVGKMMSRSGNLWHLLESSSWCYSQQRVCLLTFIVKYTFQSRDISKKSFKNDDGCSEHIWKTVSITTTVYAIDWFGGKDRGETENLLVIWNIWKPSKCHSFHSNITVDSSIMEDQSELNVCPVRLLNAHSIYMILSLCFFYPLAHAFKILLSRFAHEFTFLSVKLPASLSPGTNVNFKVTAW